MFIPVAAAACTDSLVKCIANGADPTNFDTNTIVNAITFLRNMLVGVAAIYALVFLILATFQFFTAYGNEEKISKAKKSIVSVIIGIVLVILSQVIAYEVYIRVIGAPPPPTVNQTGGTSLNPPATQ